MRHAVQERDSLVRVDGDEDVSGVRVDVVVREAGVQQAQQRGLVETVQLSCVLERKKREKKTGEGRFRAYVTRMHKRASAAQRYRFSQTCRYHDKK